MANVVGKDIWLVGIHLRWSGEGNGLFQKVLHFATSNCHNKTVETVI